MAKTNQNNSCPLVSVILPTYNTGSFINNSVKSILNQSYKNIELIIVDDGSTDNTQHILKKYMSQIIYIYQENAGPSEARNTGIKASSGELIAYQDADDVSLFNRIEKQVDFLLANPKKHIVYVGMTNIYQDGKRNEKPARSGTAFDLLQNNYVHGSTVMHWKNILDDVGMWDETVDWGLYVRMSEKYTFGCISECLYDRNLHANNISSTRGRLKNRLIDLQMFKDRHNRKKELWMAVKILRVSIECKILEKNIFKNKKTELVFWYGFHKVTNMLEKTIYIIESILK